MQKVKTPSRASGRSAKATTLPMLYVLFWSFAGAASVAYLGIVITDPNLVNALSTPAQPAYPDERNTDELLASPQVDTLRDRLSDAQMEIAKLRSELNERKQAYAEEQGNPDQASAEEPEIVASHHEAPAPDEQQPHSAPYEREETPPVAVPGISVPGISLFEPPNYAAHAPAQHSSPPDTAPSAPISEVAIANAALENGPSEPSTIEPGAISGPPAPTPGLRPKPLPVAIVNDPKPAADKPVPAGASPIKVAPVKVVKAPEAPATIAREAAPATSTFGVRLATAPTLDALRLTWKAMRDRHPETLKGLAPRYVKQDALGAAPFTLVAGPVGKSTDVLEICADLGGEVRECALTTFAGKTL